MIIDSHTHVGHFNNRRFSVDELVASMKEANIDISVLIADNHRHNPDGIYTDELIKYSKKYPQLKVIGEFNLETWGEEQFEKLKTHLTNNDIYGIKFFPGYQNYYPYDTRLDKLYAFCEKNGKPVIFHTGLLEVNTSGSIKQSHPLHIDDVAQKFPKLKIVMAHMGYPWIIDTAGVMYRNKNVYCDLSAFFAEYKPITQRGVDLFKQYMDTYKLYIGHFRKCLFGTDWPLYSQKEYISAVQQYPFTDEERELVFWKNAKNVFNL